MQRGFWFYINCLYICLVVIVNAGAFLWITG
jgi:hypothetical protein